MPEKPLYTRYMFQNLINLSVYKTRLAIAAFPKGVY